MTEHDGHTMIVTSAEFEREVLHRHWIKLPASDTAAEAEDATAP